MLCLLPVACARAPGGDACPTCAVAPAQIDQVQAKLAGLGAEPNIITLPEAELTALLQSSVASQATACIADGRLYLSVFDARGRHGYIVLDIVGQNHPRIVMASVSGREAPALLRHLSTAALRAAIIDMASPRRIDTLSLTERQLIITLEP